MMSASVVELHEGNMRNILMLDVKDPDLPVGGLPEGRIYLAEYYDIALRLKNYVAKYKKMPNYINTSLGKMSLFNFMDMFSRCLNFYYDEKYLPKYINTASLSGISTTTSSATQTTYPSNFKPYLVPTAHCQSNNSKIISKSKVLSGVKGVFLYVRDYYNYLMYYNTKKGAVGTLADGSGNCCDLSHLEVALLRAKGIPARYVHVRSKFKSGTYGHVSAQGYNGNSWVSMDASNNSNVLGEIGGTVLETYGYYAELPF
jgi:hypothetical protein